VYLTEWLTVYVGDGLEVTAQRDCEAIFERVYRGRVREEDWRVRNPSALRPGPRVLQLRLPNRRGEFKDAADAVALAGDLMDGHKDGTCAIVLRGSAEERDLLEYGKKKLPDAG
jgi:hypothetical protein